MNEESNEQGQAIDLPDGRRLGYLIVGEGKPVFHFHGLPSSRLEALLVKGIASSKHLRIIGVDRPGFGLSTFASERRLRDFAPDVSFLADYLGIRKFTLVGYSAGGPYAVTCAALLAARVTRAIVISGLSLPPDTSKMTRMDKIVWKLGTMPILGTWIQKKQMNTIFEMAKDPDTFLRSKTGRNLLKDLTEDDAKWFQMPSENRNVILRSMLEAYRQRFDSIRAMIQETKLMKKGWDIDLSQIPRGMVHIWHGACDKSVPVGNAYRNASAIPEAHLEIFENAGHMFLLSNLEKLAEMLGS